MACFWLNQNETSIQVTSAEEINAITFYKIFVKVSNVQWVVLHRYNDFYELHNKLVCDHGVSKDILPPKKVIRNKCPEFIESRRKALETYLQYLLKYLKRTMPRAFVEFLHLDLYDTFYLTQTMGSLFFVRAEEYLSSSKAYSFNPLQMHAINECLKKPCPDIEQYETRYDLSHVLDFISRLKKVIISGQLTTYVQSNLYINNLSIDFVFFKILEELQVNRLNLENVLSLGNLRNTLKYFGVHETDVTRISQVLQCDIIHKNNLADVQVWTALKKLDLSSNALIAIDDSIKLVPNLEILILNNNKINSISNLSSLTKLKDLHISNNLISTCDDMHKKLGNIKLLNLSQNLFSSIEGLSKLYSIEILDLSCNKIDNINSLSCIVNLPCLENLNLTGNVVSTVIDYRIKTLENFGERARDICLDNEKPSQAEIDKVSILRALRIVREGKTPDLSTNFN